MLREWSDQNPNHLPIFIEINAVDEPGDATDDLRDNWTIAFERQVVEAHT